MSTDVYQVDAFTDVPFAGNPAAVCLDPPFWNGEWMQAVASEMNLSETAFLNLEPGGAYRLRWFTPSSEVDLCGHATLAAAHVLWEEDICATEEPASFETKSGRLKATKQESWISLDFPADPPRPVEPPPQLLHALGILDPHYVGRSSRDYLVRCATMEDIQALDPDLDALAAIDTRGVIVTAPTANDEFDEGMDRQSPAPDFVSRFFAPAVGVPEDPVTGSAHCALGPYWSQKLGRTSLVGQQISARGGTVRTELADPSAERITLSGQATTTLRGQLTV